MRFDDSYFQGEEREGFFVEDKMKRAWAAQIEVLEEIDRICSRHNIMYYAGYGTLLGASGTKGLFRGMTIWIFICCGMNMRDF